MPPRPVLLLITLISLVGATFSLPGGIAAASALESTGGSITKWVKGMPVLAQRSPATSEQLDRTDSTSSVAAANPSPTASPGSAEPSPKPLTLGSKSDAVRDLQAVLKRLGYFYGAVNGVLGKDTQTAINRFQKEAGLPETTEVDPATLEQLKQAERSLSAQGQPIASTPSAETDGAASAGSSAAVTPALGGSTLAPYPTSAAIPGDGVGEIGWVGWVMGSLTGLAIAGGLVYGLYRSGSRLAVEETDRSLSGADASKIFVAGLEEELEEELEAEPDVSSPPTNSLNGRGADVAGADVAGTETQDERSPEPATAFRSGAALPSFLVSQPDPGQPGLEPAQAELPYLGSVQRSMEPAVNASNVSEIVERVETLAIQSTEPNAINETTRIPKLNLVDQLLNDLNSADPVQRHGAIWELGQEGDSRAVQPLVDLMLEADSQERTLILAAIAEISIRTLKPMKRALLTSLQDANSDVRKNAIRDTTRVYDMMAQLSQLLSHAVNDSDPEVQDTAQWALAQISRLRPMRGDNGSTSSDPDREEEG